MAALQMVGEESAFSFLMGSTRATADRNVKGARALAHGILTPRIQQDCKMGYSATTRTNRGPSNFLLSQNRIALKRVCRAIRSPVSDQVALTVSTSVIYCGPKADTESALLYAFFSHYSGR